MRDGCAGEDESDSDLLHPDLSVEDDEGRGQLLEVEALAIAGDQGALASAADECEGHAKARGLSATGPSPSCREVWPIGPDPTSATEARFTLEDSSD